VHGGRDAVDTLLKHPKVRAISFVGSTGVARYIYETGTKHGKRVQAAGGAKNFILIMPDADVSRTVEGVIGASFGCAGERCMAVSVLVAVGPVGDELVDVARTPGPGQVYDVNSFSLAAAARDAGAEANRVGIAPSDPRRFRELIEARLLVSEAVLIAGAAGGHNAELVVEALADLGELDLSRVAMQPGSAQGFGLLGPDKVPTFLLPANPVSALVMFEVIVRPVLRIMLGRRNPYRRTVMARTLEPIVSPVGRRQFLRGQLMRDDEEIAEHEGEDIDDGDWFAIRTDPWPCPACGQEFAYVTGAQDQELQVRHACRLVAWPEPVPASAIAAFMRPCASPVGSPPP